jgi:hypothetical protein
MASNIPIKLTGDNKSALAAISGVQKGLGNLGTGVDKLNKKMDTFTNALVGVGIVAFTKSLLTSADQLQDMSDALGVNTARLLEMGVAAAASGSSMEGLTSMLFKMEQNIGAAVDGSGEMQKALIKVGISANDVANLKPDQIFNKIAVALSKVTDPMTRARLQTELFGKASKGFSAQSYVAEIEKIYGTMDKYTQSTADAAKISDSLGMFITLVKAEFLALLQPILNLITPLAQTGDAMKAAAVSAKVLLGALGVFVGAQIINGIMSIVGGLKSLASFMGLAAVTTKAQTRETLLNAGAQTFLNGAIGRVGTATTALFVAQQELNRAIAAGITEEATLTRLRNAEAAATVKLATANKALAASAASVGINLAANGGNAAKTTGIFRTLTGVLFGVSFGIAAIVKSFGIIALVLGAVTILWEAFGDILTRWAKGTATFVIEKFSMLVDFLKKVGRGIREVTDAIGLTTAKATTTAPGNIGATETPAYAPSLLTQPAKSSDMGWVSKEASDANKALEETIRKLQEETQLQKIKMDLARQGTFYAETEANIQKTIGEETAKLAKTNQTLSLEKAGQIRSAITQSALLTKQADITEIIKKSDTEVALLGIKDTKEREIQAQLREVIAKYGKMLNASDIANLDTALRINQAKRDQIVIEEGLDRLRSKNIAKTPENALAGAGIAQTDMEKLQAVYDLQAEQLKQALDRNLITQEAYQAALNNLQLAQYNGELDLVIRNFDLKEELRQKEINAEAAKYAELLVQQKDFMGQQLFTNAQAKQIALDRANFEKKTDLQKTQFAIQQGADMFNALGAQNKKAFEVAKAFNIASAIMNTFVGASQALKMYPPPFSFIAAAAQVAFGLAQVAQIRAQTFSGRALGGPMVGGQGYLVGEKGPEIFTPSTAGTMTPNDKLGIGGATNITFNIVANDTKGFDQLLVERRPLITKIIRDAQLEQGRRSL